MLTGRVSLAASPWILSPMWLEEVFVSVPRQIRHQFIVGPAERRRKSEEKIKCDFGGYSWVKLDTLDRICEAQACLWTSFGWFSRTFRLKAATEIQQKLNSMNENYLLPAQKFTGQKNPFIATGGRWFIWLLRYKVAVKVRARETHSATNEAERLNAVSARITGCYHHLWSYCTADRPGGEVSGTEVDEKVPLPVQHGEQVLHAVKVGLQ